MDATNIITNLMLKASNTKDDAEANLLSHLANRISHQGSPFEKPLTKQEISAIQKYIP
jgi:hypothetical protein